MFSPDTFRLHGQSLAMYGARADTQTARNQVFHLATTEDGYTSETLTHLSGARMSRRILELSEMVEHRLRENPKMVPYAGVDLRWYFMGSPHQVHGIGDEARQELARMMRLTPFTGVSFGVESLQPQEMFAGVRSIRAKYTRGVREWKEGIFLGWTDGVEDMEVCSARSQ